jgi:hypothetical protein
MRLLLLFLLAALAAAAPSRAQEADIVAEARAFMEGYGRELLAGDRAGVAARYHPDGAVMAFNGQAERQTWAQIAARYAGDWSPPLSFSWSDLGFTSTDPHTVVVIGRFTWGAAEGRSAVLTYHGQLVRTPEGLRLVVEHETLLPPERSP